jgi:hypothetical protein
LLGSQFAATAPAFGTVPTGTTDVYETVKLKVKPYLSLRYRKDGLVDRKTS